MLYINAAYVKVHDMADAGRCIFVYMACNDTLIDTPTDSPFSQTKCSQKSIGLAPFVIQHML